MAGRRNVRSKVRDHRLLITVSKQEHRLIRRAAKVESEVLGLRIPIATFIRRAAVYAAENVLGHGAEERRADDEPAE